MSGSSFFLTSFTQSFDNYDFASVDTLRLTWAREDSGAILIRAESINRGLAYRMDTSQPVGNGGYRWPAGGLRAERIARQNLAIRAWTRRTLGGREIDIYRPLNVRLATGSGECGDYTFTFWPGVRLSQVEISLWQLDNSGAPQKEIFRDRPLSRGPYYAEEPIRYTLRRSEIVTPGLYRIKALGRYPGSGASAPEYTVILGGDCPE